MNRADVAAMIDHTLLAPEATPDAILALAADAVQLGVDVICVSPRWAGLAVGALRGTNLHVASVVGFPSGAHIPEIKAFEAQAAVHAGAREIDMVISVGAAVAGTWLAVADDIRQVREAVPSPTILKVIVESAALTDDQLVRACEIAVTAGADYVKTSTGFHPAGGASVTAVRLMRATVGPTIGVKASGGIRDTATALAMIEAGADRLGTSASAAILAGLD